MAQIRWEVTPAEWLELRVLIEEAEEVSQTGPESKLDELTTRIQRYPGYPSSRGPEDTVVIVPKNTRIWVTQDPNHKDTPNEQPLPGLPR
jgi:hypothetical protein